MRFPHMVALSSALLLVACGGVTATYTLTFDDSDSQRQSELTSAAARVMERRLLSLKQEIDDGDVVVKGNTIVVKIVNKETAKQLSEQLSAPFTLQIMVEADDASADVTHPRFGAFKETGIEAKHFDWVEVGPSTGDATLGKAIMKLTPEGQTLLKTVFAQNKGKSIGIFLRDVLMSQKQVTETEPTDAVVIEGIPNLDTAAVFADDVNVGLHVTFGEK